MSFRDKIVSTEKLAALVADCHGRGESVVQAHGAFDLLHLGHVKHLEAGRALGDRLIVTVTGDRYINKGPGRPVFQEYQRAEMLAALDIVDWVAVNQALDAVEIIGQVKADIYLKGQDYQNPEGDITGKIVAEREAVESVGGQIRFTEEETFSSSELINRHMNVFEPHVRQHLDSLRGNGGLDALTDLVESVADYKVLLLGDAIIDEYHYVLPMGKSAKENMIACRYQDQERFAGGVFATANNVAAICREVEVVTVLGDRFDYRDFIDGALRDNVTLTALTRPNAPTTCKRRFVDPGYLRKLFEVYFMDDEPLVAAVREELCRTLRERIRGVDLVIVNDFGHGLIDDAIIALLVEEAPFLAINAQSNSANMGFNLITRYGRADYVCIDNPEARLAIGDKIKPLADLIAEDISPRLQCDKIIVTHGKHGCAAFEKGQPVHSIPAFTKNVVDTVGAGDAFLAITAPLVHAGGPMNQIGMIGNVAGALKTAVVGHREYIEKPALLKALKGLLT